MVLTCCYAAAELIMAFTGLSIHLTEVLLPWSVPNYSHLLMEGVHREMSNIYPSFFPQNFSEATQINRGLALVSYSLLARHYFLSQDNLAFLLNMMCMAGLQVIHAMNKHLELDYHAADNTNMDTSTHCVSKVYFVLLLVLIKWSYRLSITFFCL